MSAEVIAGVDVHELRGQISAMYREVAQRPDGTFHFETGRGVAERLGYPEPWLDAVPPESLRSYAGVGLSLDLARLQPGERVLDLGCGSGTDTFVAAHLVGPAGSVTGVDMTREQLAKAESQRRAAGVANVRFLQGHVEAPPVADGSADVVISNGVFNLVPDKGAVFAAIARALRPGGRMAIADVVSEEPIAERTRCNIGLWAACIAGAAPFGEYLAAIEAAGLRIQTVRDNDYAFTSRRAVDAAAKYGARSLSVLALIPS